VSEVSSDAEETLSQRAYIARRLIGNVYELSGPCKMVVKTIEGKYFTKPFIGEEEFVLGNVYTSKTGKIILVFATTGQTNLREVVSVEVPLGQCSLFTNFEQDYSEALYKALFNEGMVEKEVQKDIKDLYADREDFGSW